MRLHRKLYTSSDYYKGLNEAEKEWLKGYRDKLAEKYKNKRKNIKDSRESRKLLNDLKSEIESAELAIRGESSKIRDNRFKKEFKYLKNSVNETSKRKLAEEGLKKQRNLENLAKLKKAGKITLVVGGTALGLGLGAKVINSYKENKKKEDIKNKILK